MSFARAFTPIATTNQKETNGMVSQLQQTPDSKNPRSKKRGFLKSLGPPGLSQNTEGSEILADTTSNGATEDTKTN
ncbi:hypothetical protein [Acaryochloris marina]|uniref:hypothetical protein n=1 Tax=Acaryochloris marina TaxID=155978 RepID=UPI0011D0E283|nr:hypothetical protein [Acaryochloris marina]